MGKLTAFTHISVDGFFAGPKGEIDWFKAIQKSKDWDDYTHGQAKSGSTLVMGRTTYDQMKSYWPTPKARKDDPKMAAVVDDSPKIVFSRKMKEAPEEPHWKNITLLHEIDKKTIRKTKERTQRPFTILGSGTIVRQMSDLGLIDEYDLVIVPVVLGEGQPLFDSVKQKELELLESRSFDNGVMVLRYKPA
jgi:dihydrofolate reductase